MSNPNAQDISLPLPSPIAFVLELFPRLPDIVPEPEKSTILAQVKLDAMAPNPISLQAERGKRSEPIVSVIIPAYNAEKYINRTLHSASAQSYRNLDIVVIDDGSKDSTSDIVRARMADDCRIRLITQPNAGVAAARNIGIAEAWGELIATLDADDLWHPIKLEMQVRRLLADSSAGLVYCWSAWIDMHDRIYWQPPSPPTFQGHVLAAAIFQNFVGNSSSPLMRRSCVERVGGYDEELRKNGAEGCEDYKLYIELAATTSFTLVPLFLVGYRIHGDSMSQEYSRMLRSHRVMLADVRRRWPQVPQRIYRWSKAGVATHLAMRAAARGDFRNALQLWGLALCRDPALLLSSYRHLTSTLNRGSMNTASTAEEISFLEAPISGPVVVPHLRSQARRNFVQQADADSLIK